MNATMESPPIFPPKTVARRRNIDALAGVLIGTAVGDALGLPMEGLSARRQQKLFPGPLKHRLIGRWGMVSDDTEHTVMLAQALLESPGGSVAFQRNLARRLRWWLVGLPAGVGFATLRSILRLWFGVPASRSGVMSAGNGAAMRSALPGVFFADSPADRRQLVQASTQITHRDPRANAAALAVAETTTWMIGPGTDTDELVDGLKLLSEDPEWADLMESLRTAFTLELPVIAYAQQLGATAGVSGYAWQSIPVAIHAAVRHRDDFPAAVSEAIACGGDTDTVAAITGAMVGARVGVAGIPQPWREGLVEFPYSLAFLHRLATQLGHQMETRTSTGPVHCFWPAIPLRNLVFLSIVLFHGFRRLFPPY